MSTHPPSKDEQLIDPTSAVEGSEVAAPAPQSASQHAALPKPQEAEDETFFSFVEEEPLGQDTSFVEPFQLSGPMPRVSAQAQQPDQVSAVSTAPAASTKKSSRKPRFSLTLIAIVVCSVVIVGMVIMNALAQTTPPLQTRGNGVS